MAARFVLVDHDTPLLLPPDLREWVPASHLVHFIMDAVGHLEVSKARVNERGTGDAQYPSAMMLGLLIYSYATGVFSSRQIERSTYENVAVRVLCADTHPDHDTICAFRRQNGELLSSSFAMIQAAAGPVGEVLIDSGFLSEAAVTTLEAQGSIWAVLGCCDGRSSGEEKITLLERVITESDGLYMPADLLWRWQDRSEKAKEGDRLPVLDEEMFRRFRSCILAQLSDPEHARALVASQLNESSSQTLGSGYRLKREYFDFDWMEKLSPWDEWKAAIERIVEHDPDAEFSKRIKFALQQAERRKAKGLKSTDWAIDDE